MAALHISNPVNGERNVSILVKGVLDKELSFTPLLEKPVSKMKLTEALWLIQEKMGLVLWWDKGNTLVMPMESRNSIRLDRGWNSPEGWEGQIYLSSFNCESGWMPKLFTIELSFDKQ